MATLRARAQARLRGGRGDRTGSSEGKLWGQSSLEMQGCEAHSPGSSKWRRCQRRRAALGAAAAP